MAYEPKPGDGALFKNDKGDNAARPDYRGHILADRDMKAGDKIEIASWIKDGAKGKFMSLKGQQPRGQQSGGGETAPGSDGIGGGDDPDRIPFITRWGYL